MRPQVVFWPDEEERKQISNHVMNNFDMPNCIGIVDGTLFPLEFKPTLQGENFFTRKGGYAVHSLIICDDQSRIRGITLGYPGSVHDNRVWTRSCYFQDQGNYFNHKEYLLGDSAFKPSSVMVPSFKKPFGQELDAYKSFLNTNLAKPRIKSEHCIAALKGRFQLLKRLRVVISKKKLMIRVNRIIVACAVMHNLMLEEPCPEEWIEADDFDDIDIQDIEQVNPDTDD